MTEKHNLQDSARPSISFFITAGLAEATATIAVFLAMCLFPQWFPVLAWLLQCCAFILRLRVSYRPHELQLEP
jgi:hypothetical protein